MKLVYGNLWDTPADAHVVTTNGTLKRDGRAVMGRGIAQAARDMFPGIDTKLGRYLSLYGNRPFNLGTYVYQTQPYRIWTMPTKETWTKRSDINLILDSAIKLMEMADRFKLTDILMPRPGVGNGGLDWYTEVADPLRLLLDDRFTVITWHPAFDGVVGPV